MPEPRLSYFDLTSNPVNIRSWIDSNQREFRPPICNQLLSDNQLKVMLVGGPNSRSDFHIEDGPELFLQVEGSMSLLVHTVEGHRSISIAEGECFLLPPRVPHSPQRFANTVGLVIERRRAKHELDALRYYVENSDQVLWEKSVHIENLVKDLPPIIAEYKKSTAFATGQPRNLPCPLARTNLLPPSSIPKPTSTRSLKAGQNGAVLDSTVADVRLFDRLHKPVETIEVEQEAFLLQLMGESSIIVGDVDMELRAMDCIVVEKSRLEVLEKRADCKLLMVQMPTPRE